MGRKRASSLDAIGRTNPSAAKPDQPAPNGDGGAEIESGSSGGDAASGAAIDLAGLDGTSGGGGGDSGPQRVKRKYTPRAGKSAAETRELDLTEFISENLFAMHAFLAALSGKDILAIEKSEADEVGKSIQGVAQFYEIPGVNAKTVAWVRLARTLGMVYGARIFASRAARQPTPLRVVPKTEGPQLAEVDGSASPRQAEARRPPAPAGMVWASPGPGLPDVLMPRQ